MGSLETVWLSVFVVECGLVGYANGVDQQSSFCIFSFSYLTTSLYLVFFILNLNFFDIIAHVKSFDQNIMIAINFVPNRVSLFGLYTALLIQIK